MRLLLILLFIPFLSFSQTYNEVMSISSLDMFKKVAIENKYEFSENDEYGWIIYGLDMIKDSIEGNKASQWLNYNKTDDRFSLVFSIKSINLFGVETNTDNTTYELIVKEIKEKCKYYKIQNYGGTDYVTYTCSDSSYKGKIGFVIEGDWGYVRHFPTDL